MNLEGGAPLRGYLGPMPLRPLQFRQNSQRDSAPLSRAAFSLVEVVMALGIFTFALVAILGLLPAAVLSARESLNLAASLQLADQLHARLNAAPSASLKTGEPPQTYFFNDLGAELDNTEADKAIYKASVSLEAADSDHLVRVAITIRPATGGATRSFSYLIFKNL